CLRVPDEVVEEVLLKEIGKLKALTEGAREAGAVVHTLPERPGDVKNDGEFHYAVLGAKAASSSGSPSAEARRFLAATTGPDNPRVYRNAVVLAVPARESLDGMRDRVRRSLAWGLVEKQLGEQGADPIREEALAKHLSDARKEVPRAIRQGYCIVVTVSR